MTRKWRLFSRYKRPSRTLSKTGIQIRSALNFFACLVNFVCGVPDKSAVVRWVTGEKLVNQRMFLIRPSRRLDKLAHAESRDTACTAKSTRSRHRVVSQSGD